ncbi:MAG: bifunctional 4-hydroxy-3-methylbut-2-enyl diphosphate reductase/30S ribosomal protein S1 [Christensenellales bacterium]
MRIEIAEKGGFCFGVRRALDSVLRCMQDQSIVYTLGPVIHNPQVVAMLERQGVRVAGSADEVAEGTLVIRSHGAPPEVYAQLSARGIRIVDATCPRVRRIQEKVRECHRADQPVIVIGERDHPEVQGISGWCGHEAHVVNSAGDVYALPPMDSACVVAQTTLTQQKWDELVPLIRARVTDCDVFESMCLETRERQQEAAAIAQRSDAMIIVGGRNSSNTRKLYEICRQVCRATYEIETAEQLKRIPLCRYERIGIASGTSTPDWIIKEVYRTMSDITDKDMPVNQGIEGMEEMVAEPVNPEAVAPESAAEQQAPAESSEPMKPETEAPQSEEPSKVDPPVEKTAAESFMEDVEKTLVSIHTGQIISGKVVAVSENEVCVNIGYKSDGIISRSEYSSDPDIVLRDVVQEGDEIEVEVIRVNDGEGNVLLSKKSVDARKNWKKLLEAYEEGKVFAGVGRQAVKGGLICSINGVRAFVPASHLDTRYVDDIDEYVGKEIKLKILEVEKHRRRVVASRKQVILDEQEEKKRQVWNALKEGTRVRGIVRRLTDFGAFVDIGGIDGLVHVTDLAWGRVQHPRDIVRIGEEIEVIILKVDVERERVSLGLKQTKPKPWEVAQDKYIEGSIVTGRVVRIVSFGAFVELEPGLDGLVHISQIADHRIEKVEDALSIGQEVDVKILSVNPEQRRISLSIREAQGGVDDYGTEDGGSSLMYSTSDYEE